MRSHFSNQKGGMTALLSVVILTGIIVTTLTSAYMFIENSSKYNGRIKAAYETASAIEDMARNIRQIYDSTLNSGAMVFNGSNMTPNPAACDSATTVASRMSNGQSSLLLCVPRNMISNSGFGCTRAPCMCIRNAAATSFDTETKNPTIDDRYCMNMPAWAANESSSPTVVASQTVQPTSRLEKWLARMDLALDTTIAKQKPHLQNSLHAFLGYDLQKPTALGWILPQRAWAESKDFEPHDKANSGSPGRGQDQNTALTSSANGSSVVVTGCKSTSGDDDAGSLSALCETCTGLTCMTLQLPNVACKETVAQSSCGIATVNVKFE